MGRIVKRLSFASLRSVLAGAFLLMGLGGVIVSTAFDTPPTVRTVGGDTPVNEGATEATDIRSNNSPTLARNPTSNGNLVVANRIDTPGFGCAMHVSFDGGAEWTDTPLPLPEGEEPKCFGPDAVFASDGTLYVSFVTLEGRGNTPNAAWIVNSTDGGRTFSEPVRALGRELTFQVRLAVDAEDPRRVYLTWLQGADVGFLKFAQPGNPILSTRSEDGGSTWSTPERVSSPARGRSIAPTPAVGPDGELYVLYLDLRDDQLDYEGAHRGEGGPPYQGRFSLVLARSLDGGRTWGESVVGDRIVPIDRFVVFYAPTPSIAVAPDGRVYAAFHGARLGDPDVWLWSLATGSEEWEGPTRVNDTPEGDGTAQYLPQVEVAPTGRLDVTYYDRRSDPDGVMNHVSLQSSFDEGESFTASARLSSQPFSSRVGFGSRNDLPTLGSRLALVSAEDRALAVWTDTRAGTVATNKQDLARAVVSFSEPARLSSAAEAGLRYGGIALMLLGLGILLAGWALRGRRRAATAGS
jgi:hypothetical protein